VATGPVHLSLLLLACHSTYIAAGGVYRWTDDQGQVHFSDIAPLHGESTEILIESPRVSGARGLRPGEISTLKQIRQRAIRQRTWAETSGRQSDRQTATRRKECNNRRDMFHRARDRDSFKAHARYLRNNCW
jgi:hypothetical protein